ncbi:hypothetical protein BpHYR1_003505, partial [Brachionus plicatilis]
VDGGSGIHKGEGSIYTLDLVEETVCRLSTGYEGARFEDEALEGLTDQSLLNTETESAAEFVKCLSEGFLTQNACFKTFQKEPNKFTNILDLIITEAQERMDNLEPGEVLGGKDNGHLSMSWRYKLKEKMKEFGYRFRR